ncbi:hypothetical protein FIBSPDRAFT_929931 [Athelia psychrophila]|uniref:Uncharacterized protein n=1 Tax=Athelia psychrophila TaxID=1759441 RepID=A0A166MYS5_9AGAM|nr:hypothetical protein FIBSPDRAFT_929931 [Fibularhizoctonia sp. CBS 109695]
MFASPLLTLGLLLAVPVAFAAPRPTAAQSVPASTPTLPAIIYNIPGVLNSTLIPILGEGPDGGIEVGGIGEHSAPGLGVYEHGNGDAQVGPGGIEVCLTQTFEVGPLSIAYGVAI